MAPTNCTAWPSTGRGWWRWGHPSMALIPATSRSSDIFCRDPLPAGPISSSRERATPELDEFNFFGAAQHFWMNAQACRKIRGSRDLFRPFLLATPWSWASDWPQPPEQPYTCGRRSLVRLMTETGHALWGTSRAGHSGGVRRLGRREHCFRRAAEHERRATRLAPEQPALLRLSGEANNPDYLGGALRRGAQPRL